ncbi:hypothetical protein L2Z40_18590 (plasmid) [Acinetobacter baumannii]|nr:hypothetical protein [Acinetobacter baumannii]UVU37037.1 hypothetical protein L2Z40_18590 [Acinetobacter baumannii]
MNTKYLSALKTNFINENELDSLLSEIQDLPGHPQSLTTLQDCGYKMGVASITYLNNTTQSHPIIEKYGRLQIIDKDPALLNANGVGLAMSS